MQEALESIFGPGVGLIGFIVMAIIIVPKFLVRWRGFSARKRGPVDCRPRKTGLRAIHIEPFSEVACLEPDPNHGQAMAIFTPNIKAILLEVFCWIVPLLAVLIFVPVGYQSLRMMLLVITIPIACVGIMTLFHLRDKFIFYRTGAVFRLRFKKVSLDYNSIYSMTERKSMLPWGTPCFILHMDDEKLIVLEGSYLKRGKMLKSLFKTMDARIKTNASEETLRES